jgi:Ca2+-binding EF-hand superfamily protein
MPFTDDQIRQAVINLFKKYDKDNSGYIDQAEIGPMCNDLGNELLSKKQFTKEQINATLSTIDKNQDGRLSLDEVFALMRKLNP